MFVSFIVLLPFIVLGAKPAWLVLAKGLHQIILLILHCLVDQSE